MKCFFFQLHCSTFHNMIRYDSARQVVASDVEIENDHMMVPAKDAKAESEAALGSTTSASLVPARDGMD